MLAVLGLVPNASARGLGTCPRRSVFSPVFSKKFCDLALKTITKVVFEVRPFDWVYWFGANGRFGHDWRVASFARIKWDMCAILHRKEGRNAPRWPAQHYHGCRLKAQVGAWPWKTPGKAEKGRGSTVWWVIATNFFGCMWFWSPIKIFVPYLCLTPFRCSHIKMAAVCLHINYEWWDQPSIALIFSLSK